MKDVSFLNTLLLVQGVRITGFDEGDDVIQMRRLADGTTHIVGADGEMIVSVGGDRSGEVIFRLNQASNSSEFLYGLSAAAENGAFAPIFVQLKDLGGGILGSGTQGYIPRPADVVRGAGPNSQEWRIVVERLDLLFTGF